MRITKHHQAEQPAGADAVPEPELARATADPQRDEAVTALDASSRVFLASLFNKYRASLFRYLNGLVPTSEDAAELVQESYTRLLRQSNVLRLEVVARTYLFQTATNLARDHFRRRVSHHAQHHIDIDDESIADDSANPEQTFAWNQTVESIKQGIKDMPPLTRKVFLLSRFRNKTYPQIAAILGVSTRTVERKMSEAMSLLSRHVGEGS